MKVLNIPAQGSVATAASTCPPGTSVTCPCGLPVVSAWQLCEGITHGWAPVQGKRVSDGDTGGCLSLSACQMALGCDEGHTWLQNAASWGCCRACSSACTVPNS